MAAAAAPISTRAPRKIARGNAYERPATPPKRPCCWKRDGGCLGQPSIRTSCDAAAIRFLTPRVHREHPLREPERPTRRWAAAALAQRMWRRCAARADAVEMIMAYHGAAPDGPSSPLATAASCGTASLSEADETADELGGRGGRGSAVTRRS